MIMITVSISDSVDNENAAAAVTFFLARAYLTEEEVLQGIYHSDKAYITLADRKGNTEDLKCRVNDPLTGRYSHKHLCMCSAAQRLKEGDRLMASSLSDFGNTWEEASALYFRLLKNGIELEFYDAPYIDTEKLGLTAEISEDKEEIIKSIIRIYYCTEGKEPKLEKQELAELSEYSITKKKSVY